MYTPLAGFLQSFAPADSNSSILFHIEKSCLNFRLLAVATYGMVEGVWFIK
jgi:hypothetical protein